MTFNVETGWRDRDLLQLCSFYELTADPRSVLETQKYVREQKLDVKTMAALCGSWGVVSVFPDGDDNFIVKDHWRSGVPGFVIEAADWDGESIVDLVAWPTEYPDNYRSLAGRATLLGLWTAESTAPRVISDPKAIVPLQVRKNPLEWLQAGCTGVALANPGIGSYELERLAHLHGALCAKDREHAEFLAKLMPRLDRSMIVYPSPVARERRRAA